MTTPLRARPLPPTPGPSSFTLEPATIASYNGSNRNSVLTFNTIGTNLPRYSGIDFSYPPPPFDSQIDHWNEGDIDTIEHAGNAEGTPAATPTTTLAFPQPPQYSADPTTRTQRRRPNLVLHKFYLKGKGKSPKSWATLKLISRAPAPGSKTKTPRFIGGDSLRGFVDINLDGPLTIHNINIELKGKVQLTRCIVDSPELREREHIFMHKSHVIFSKKTSGDPRWNGRCEISKNKPYDGSMHGSYSFPFAFPFPVSVVRNNQPGRHETPIACDALPSFQERNESAEVIYEVTLVIGHGTLRTKSKAATDVIFVPKQVSPPASEKRQAAYLEGALLPGPRADPEGWKDTVPLTVRGEFQDRAVEVTCTLSLAMPSSYTRGTVIPCYLTLSSLDFQFLDNLATPNTINLQLSRYVRIPWQGQGIDSASSYDSPTKPQPMHVANAVWWRPAKTDTPESPRERQLEGEIHLGRHLMPSCNSSLFTIEYVVELMPFSLETFILTNGRNKTELNDECPILKYPVSISNFHEHGPVPIPFTNRIKNHESKERARSGRWEEYDTNWYLFSSFS